MELGPRWLDNQGNSHLISGMKTAHIQNCISRIERLRKAGKGWRQEYLPELRQELKSRKTDNYSIW